jgi:hypothetical protein
MPGFDLWLAGDLEIDHVPTCTSQFDGVVSQQEETERGYEHSIEAGLSQVAGGRRSDYGFRQFSI